MEATASARYLRGSAQKARLVVDMIRGKDVNQALAILRFSKKRAASSIAKCMRSAIANANEAAEKANISIDPDDLWVRTAFVDRGPTKNRRRVRPAPQGRAYREQRHFCHVTILLSNDERPAAKGTRPAEADEAKPAKLAASKRRKRGGAAAAPRTKRTTSKTEAAAAEKPATKKASKKKAKTEE
ncbi:MAG TPA: 50S ribosomal protein L22 [Pyrinomonadaceae bacterium]|jgi:large subunit ribosomal protein L22|nr:50S ribosomal protein L22 [Pyrinomonadaceae bacterium]